MKFEVELGDWSNDGHGRTEKYLLLTDTDDTSDIYKAYEKSKEVTGINLSTLCSEYDDAYIEEDTLPAVISLLEEMGDDFLAKQIENDGGLCMSDELINIIIAAINKVDPSLNVRFANNEETIPLLTFSGRNDDGGICVPGYGCI